jgi:hypothetical protein
VARRGLGHRLVWRVLIGATLLWLAGAAAASAQTVHVTSSADSGTGTLRAAIAAAANGDTIVIDPGVDPHLTAGDGGISIFANQFGSLAIVGQGARSTTITGDGVDSTLTLDDNSDSDLAPVVTISGVTLTGGGGTEGGAIAVGGNTSATLSAVTLSGNMVTNNGPAFGGAVFAGGTVTLDGVTAFGNSASTDGGALYNNGATVDINNSTITGNTAVVGGGGIYTTGQSFLVGDTLAGNQVTDGAGGNIDTNFLDSGTMTTLTDTIMSGGSAASGPNCVAPSGAVVSDGHNLESTTPDQCGLTGTGDQVGANPLLNPLGDYGGPTDTMALAPGSPAISHANCADFSPAVDQRGLPRPGAGETGCDIGADEFQNGTSAAVNCPSTAVDQATPCTATVTAPAGEAPAPTGPVTLTSNGAGTFASGGKCTLAPTAPAATSSSCSVAYTPSALGSGSQVITMTYGGDTADPGATASTTLSITLRSTAVALSCTPNPAGLQAPTTCSATVTDQIGAGAGPPTGTVAFSGTAGSFGTTSTCMLSGSGATASCTVPLTPNAVGSKQVTAAYSGDATHAPSSASTALVVRAGPPEGMSVLCAPGTVSAGASTTCTATVDAGADGSSTRATGSVAFSVNGATTVHGGGNCTLAPSGSGAACAVTYTLGGDATGTYDVTATYAGDAHHPAASIPTSFAVTPVAGKAANAAVVSGTVTIELPSGHSFAPLIDGRASPVPGVISPIKGATVAVPIGSTVDTTKGTLHLASAASYNTPAKGPPALQNATLSASIFTIEQMTAKQARSHLKRGRRLFGIPPMNLHLRTPRGATAKARCHRSGAPGKGTVRAISGTAKGEFRTIGANSITTVESATWIVSDRCDGTLTEVGRGRATVTPIHPAHKHEHPVTITAGQGVLIKGRFV